MKFKFTGKRRKSLKRICSIVLSAIMIINLMVGYQVMAVAENSIVKADSSTTSAPYRNVVYYGEWSIYAGQKYFYPSKIDGSMITHLNFAFLDVDSNGDLVLCDEHIRQQSEKVILREMV